MLLNTTKCLNPGDPNKIGLVGREEKNYEDYWNESH